MFLRFGATYLRFLILHLREGQIRETRNLTVKIVYLKIGHYLKVLETLKGRCKACNAPRHVTLLRS